MAKFIYRNWRYAILVKQINRYDKYKDSGIEWIGKIPQHWNVERLKKIFTFGKGLSITRENLIEIGIPVISYGQIHSKTNTGTQISDDLIRYVPETYLETNIQSLVNKGDFIFADTSEDIEGAGNCVFVDKQLTLFAGYHSIILKNKVHNYILGKYLSYLFQTDLWRTQVRANVNGIKVYSISQKILKNITVLVPQENEQQQIADYLDKKCREIDRVVDVQKEVIEKLKEYKQSVITEAVTKGLDKSVSLKDSGIEWIGKIPQHWNVERLKKIFTFGKGLSITRENLIEIGIPVISYGQIHSKTNTGTQISDDLIRYVPETYLETNIQSLVNKGDFIFADTSEDIEGAGNCVFVDKQLTLFAGYHSIILKNKVHNYILGKYLSYLFQTDLWRTQVRANVNGIKVYSISQKILKNITALVPQKNEQEQIADYLEKKCGEIDNIINDKELLIEKFTEYKKSLIYECVTGKRKVAD